MSKQYHEEEYQFFPWGDGKKGEWGFSVYPSQKVQDACAKKMMIFAPRTFGPFESEWHARFNAFKQQTFHIKKPSFCENLLQQGKCIVQKLTKMFTKN